MGSVASAVGMDSTAIATGKGFTVTDGEARRDHPHQMDCSKTCRSF